LARPGHALAKRMRLAEGHRARQRDSRDRITGLRLAATTVRAIPTPSPGQRQSGSISASPAKRPLECSERCIRNLAAQSQRFLRLPMLRLHWRRPAIRGKIQSRRFSVAHKSQRLIGTPGVSRGRSDAWVEAAFARMEGRANLCGQVRAITVETGEDVGAIRFGLMAISSWRCPT
jgi:hypothetical protein